MEVTKTFKGDKNWDDFCAMTEFERAVIADIDSEFLDCGIMVRKGDIVLARVACFINPHHVIEQEAFGTIGYFECVEEYEVFQRLMSEVQKLFIAKGIKKLLGPIDGSTWNSYRLVSSDQSDPFLLEIATPKYYLKFFRDYGFEELAQYYSQRTWKMVDNWDKAEKVRDQFVRNGVRFEAFDLENSESEFLKLGAFCNRAFRNNFLFSPISNEKFARKMSAVLPLINPRYTILAKKEGEVVGFIFCYEDLLNTNDKTIVVKTVARNSAEEFRGLGTVISSLVMKNIMEDGFTDAIHALILDQNASKNLSSKFKAEYFRTYELLKLTIK